MPATSPASEQICRIAPRRQPSKRASASTRYTTRSIVFIGYLSGPAADRLRTAADRVRPCGCAVSWAGVHGRKDSIKRRQKQKPKHLCAWADAAGGRGGERTAAPLPAAADASDISLPAERNAPPRTVMSGRTHPAAEHEPAERGEPCFRGAARTRKIGRGTNLPPRPFGTDRYHNEGRFRGFCPVRPPL